MVEVCDYNNPCLTILKDVSLFLKMWKNIRLHIKTIVASVCEMIRN